MRLHYLIFLASTLLTARAEADALYFHTKVENVSVLQRQNTETGAVELVSGLAAPHVDPYFNNRLFYWEGEGPLYLLHFDSGRVRLMRAEHGALAQTLIDQPFTTPGASGTFSRIDEDEFTFGGIVFNTTTGTAEAVSIGNWSHQPGTRFAYNVTYENFDLTVRKLSLETGQVSNVTSWTPATAGAGLQSLSILPLPQNLGYVNAIFQMSGFPPTTHPKSELADLSTGERLSIPEESRTLFSGFVGDYLVGGALTLNYVQRTAGPNVDAGAGNSYAVSSAVDGSAYTVWEDPTVIIDEQSGKYYNQIPYSTYTPSLDRTTGEFLIENSLAFASANTRGTGPAIPHDHLKVEVSQDGTKVFMAGAADQPTLVVDVATGNRSFLGNSPIVPYGNIAGALLVPFADAVSPAPLAMHLLNASSLTPDERSAADLNNDSALDSADVQRAVLQSQ